MKIKLKSYKLLFNLLDLLSNSKWLHKLVINRKIYLGASIISLSFVNHSCTSNDEVIEDNASDKKEFIDSENIKKDTSTSTIIRKHNILTGVSVYATVPVISCYSIAINEISFDDEITKIKSKVLNIEKDTIEEITCYIIIESEPEFKGGNDSLLKYLSSNIYRSEGTEQISGTVYIGFTVEADGKISNIHIRKSLHPLLDAEVIRVITAMPDWVWPDYSKKREKTNFTIPIKFLAE
jgi:TonB family protein